MKALIIADDEIAIERFSAVLKEAGYDIIVYHWLIKAIDNIEEIAPHLIIVSAVEYPRHWKTLTQYAESGISGVIPQIILFTEKSFSEEEQNKAEILKVRGHFSSYDVDGLDQLRAILSRNDDIFEGSLNEVSSKKDTIIETENVTKSDAVIQSDNITKSETNIESENVNNHENIVETESINSEDMPTVESLLGDEVQYTTPSTFMDPAKIGFIFSNPSDETFVTGSVKEFDGSNIDFVPDYPVENCESDCFIQTAALKVENIITFVRAKIMKKESNLAIKILAGK